MATPDGDAPFVLSERSERHLSAETWNGRPLFAVGAVLVLVGVVLVVAGLRATVG